jgi:hypothetical protein
MSEFSSIVGGMLDEVGKIILGLFIAVIVCSVVFGGCGYYFGNKHGKSVGYEKGAKDALAGKISWQQTIHKDSVLILKK